MTGQSETKHTPGTLSIAADNPRKVVSDSIDGLDLLTGENLIGGASEGPYAHANAARIVLTWNCHDDLVAACQAVVDACTSAPPMDLIKRLGECADKCAAALAKASA